MSDLKCNSCGWEGTDYFWRQDRRPGLNPLESALSQKDGFTDPKPACPTCEAYLEGETV